MEKRTLRNLGIAAIIVTGSLFGVNKFEQDIQEKSKLTILVAERMSNTRDSWKDVYTKLGKEEEYLNKYSDSHKNPLAGLSKKEMIKYIELSQVILL